MKKIISVLLSICIIFSLCTISVIGSNAGVTTEYKDEFAKLALGDKYEELKNEVVYEEYYRYFSEGNNTDTPDWILGRGYYNPYKIQRTRGTFLGDYIIYGGEYFKPFTCGHFVYFPAENKFYSLENMWYSKLENLEMALKECSDNNVEGIDYYFDLHDFKYFDKVVEHFGDQYRQEIMYNYDEVYYHYTDDNSEEPDWALVFCAVRPQPWEVNCGTIVGNRALYTVGGGCIRFDNGYAVYIRETDTFISLLQSSLDDIIELCPDFVEVIEENEIGYAFGDVNEDKVINIFDATCIQRHIAEIYTDYEVEANFAINTNDGYVSMGDFDRDGKTTILDATAIQRHIAGLE